MRGGGAGVGDPGERRLEARGRGQEAAIARLGGRGLGAGVAGVKVSATARPGWGHPVSRTPRCSAQPGGRAAKFGLRCALEGGRPGKLAQLGFAPSAEWALGREGLTGGQTLNLGGAPGAVPLPFGELPV